MIWLERCFWLCGIGIAYVYVGYPLLIGLAARLFGRAPRLVGPAPRSLSIVVAAHDEAAAIVPCIHHLRNQIAAARIPGDIVVVSDGSTDETVELVRASADDDVQVIELQTNEGKAAALTAGCAVATGEILVFADVRQDWGADALRHLLSNFRDPSVGAASGNLRLESAHGVLAGAGFYWNYEKWLRARESLLHSLVGVTGAVSAVRRELFRPIPPGTLLDDVYWPLQVAMQGRRVVHDENAVVLDRLPESTGDEFRRKVRTLCGNFQIVMRCTAALAPWRNPVWLQLVSHKLLRLAVPWALMLLLLVNVFLPGPFYRVVLAMQVALYLLGMLGLRRDERPRLSVTNAASSFLLLNAAALVSFWTWILGRTDRTWTKAAYEPLSVECASHW
jgi:cellulose synthase/poly-beta-1,6-N-acetylglucosamine synthase-like glycosyltransferase